MGKNERQDENPATLVAIVIAARKAGNRELERKMRRELEDRFRVKLSFAKGKTHHTEGHKNDK